MRVRALSHRDMELFAVRESMLAERALIADPIYRLALPPHIREPLGRGLPITMSRPSLFVSESGRRARVIPATRKKKTNPIM